MTRSARSARMRLRPEELVRINRHAVAFAIRCTSHDLRYRNFLKSAASGLSFNAELA